MAKLASKASIDRMVRTVLATGLPIGAVVMLADGSVRVEIADISESDAAVMAARQRDRATEQGLRDAAARGAAAGRLWALRHPKKL